MLYNGIVYLTIKADPAVTGGIGVDDMFVMVSTLGYLSEEEHQRSLRHKIAIMLKHAGVSITVTSFTDVVAFGIGATTSLPALRSFCIFACIGVTALYLLSCTFFVACITFDEKRKDAGRNACLCCYTHRKDYRTTDCSKKERIPVFLKNIYAPFLLKTPVKIFSHFGSRDNLQKPINIMTIISQIDFFPGINEIANKDAYETERMKVMDSGSIDLVYRHTLPYLIEYYLFNKLIQRKLPLILRVRNIDYFNSGPKLNQLNSRLTSSSHVSSGSVNSWFQSFTNYLSTATNVSVTSHLDANKYPVNESSFISILYDFVTTVPSGVSHISEIKFTSSNTVIDASYISFTHVLFSDSKSEITAMENIQSLVNGIFGEDCFAYVDNYRQWATNKLQCN
ncbi:hypothetical protein KUTeg_016210 [Tegillarca granosa]|uniref:SSD domain-containing protein n=1 Tax=Tegillarca granosa TaxID=220873 RepID=A0ABQ9EQ20_TEGGR|nr:hypothetical protein KUTeg_016210 [Tegillarca granosa]